MPEQKTAETPRAISVLRRQQWVRTFRARHCGRRQRGLITKPSSLISHYSKLREYTEGIYWAMLITNGCNYYLRV